MISQFLPLPALLRLLRSNRPDPRYRRRARRRLIFSAAVEPLRWYELARYGGLLRRTGVAEPPIFLLGFGRSGTTHLHNLLWQDPRFGVVTNYQANMQPIALVGRRWLPRLLAGRMPRTRPMDNVAVTLDGPQEEEIAMVNATDHAPLHFMSFPRALPEMYDRYVCDLEDDATACAAWRRAYLDVVRKATVLAGGRRLVLKTPPNTARIGELCRMFPGARFVHIVRNPYPVYQSMRNMYRKILPAETLQEIDWPAIDAWMAQAYVRLMRKYLADRGSLDSAHLVEIRYEELELRPLETLEAIYARLALGDFATVRPRLEAYLDRLGVYEKNRFEFPPDVVGTVNQQWGFAFEAFGYERIDPRSSAA